MLSNRELKICQAIETGLSAEYWRMPELSDSQCINALENAIIALKQHFGFAKNELVRRSPAIDGIVGCVVSIGIDNIGKTDGLTLKEYIAVINKIKKSAMLHSASGPRAYYHFIRDYV